MNNRIMTKRLSIYLAALLSFIIYLPAEISAQVTVTATSGTATGSYSTVKAAFDAINAGTHKGDIAIKLSAGTTEAASAVLNASEQGSASYTSVTLYPTATGVVISGDVAAALIELNGADFVTIDGSINQTGSSVDMTIQNTSTSAIAGTSTVSFLNDALGNTLQDCNVLGSSLATSGGIIFFGAVSSYGNDDNVVSNCSISNCGGNRPLNALCSYSTGGENAQNIITSNKFYDFFNAGADSYGINLGAGSTNWSIYYNSFYETTSLSPTSAYSYYGINVNNTVGTEFNISNNYIGGKAANCGGSAFTKTSSANNVFYGIRISAATSLLSNVNGNTIKNISWANSGNAAFYGIAGSDGYLNVGTEGAGNTIGASSGSSSITYTAGATGGTFYGIYCMSAGSISLLSNTIGAVTVTNGANLVTNLYGIYSGGSNTSAGNIISGNTLLNLVNDASGTGSLINGIYISAGKNSVIGNTVHDLSIPWSDNTASNHLLSAGGIVFYNSAAVAQTINGNTIYNILNAYSAFTGSVTGIYYSGPTTASNISGNFIYSISASGGGSSRSVYGIKADAGAATFANNIISLSSNSRSVLYGIYEPGTSGSNSNIYFNTVYFTGTSCGESSYCLYSASNGNTRDFRNNILNNNRSGTTESIKQYCIYYAATAGTLTTGYNDYYGVGTGGTLGYYGGDQTIIPIVSGKDAGSLSTNPDFVNPGGTTASDYYPQTPLPGVDGTGITTDYTGITRASTPTMGAIEGQIVVTWSGVTSTDWNTATNWSGSKVPVSVQNVTIPSTTNKPHITTDPSSYSACNNLTIESGAILTIDAGKALAVYGTLANGNGTSGLVISSSASGTGMLYHTTAGISATVQRYIAAPSSWVDGTHGWHFLSSPVATQAIDTAFTNVTPENYDFFAWWEATNEWVNYKNSSTAPTWNTANVLGATSGGDNFIPGKGYLVAYSATSTKFFTGTLNVADIAVSGLTYTGSATYKGWNLLGNPFSCPISWHNAGGGWSLSNIDANCQIWNESAASYTVISAGSLIPESNGFMVHVSSPGTGSLTIPASARRLSSAPWYKSGESEENRIVLKAVDPAGQTSQETVISFYPAATEGFDPLYDSYFLAGYAPMFYSVSRNNDYALKCLPELNSSLVVPLSFIKNNSSEFGIELVKSIPGTNVYLTDLKLNKTQNLANDPVYLFSSAAGDATERFQLSFMLNGTGEEKKPASGIYAWENSVYVRNQGTSELQVYNLTGQTVFSEKISQQGLCRVVLNVPTGYYIARLTGDAGVTVKKIYINN